MPHSIPDLRERAHLAEFLDDLGNRDELRGYLRDLARTNRLTFAHRPLRNWLESLKNDLTRLDEPIRVLDVGCGYGEGRHRMCRSAGIGGRSLRIRRFRPGRLCVDRRIRQ
jgi:hypothetical protein